MQIGLSTHHVTKNMDPIRGKAFKMYIDSNLEFMGMAVNKCIAKGWVDLQNFTTIRKSDFQNKKKLQSAKAGWYIT